MTAGKAKKKPAPQSVGNASSSKAAAAAPVASEQQPDTAAPSSADGTLLTAEEMLEKHFGQVKIGKMPMSVIHLCTYLEFVLIFDQIFSFAAFVNVKTMSIRQVCVNCIKIHQTTNYRLQPHTDKYVCPQYIYTHKTTEKAVECMPIL